MDASERNATAEDGARIDAAFARHLRRLRRLADISQEDAASYLGISRVSFTNSENGHRVLRVRDLWALCELYHADMASLWDAVRQDLRGRE